MFALSLSLIAAVATSVSAGKTSQIASWPDNPTALGSVLVYTPDTPAAKPPIILGLHPCGGTGQQYYSMTNLPSYADKLGFILLYPTSKSQSGMNCWDAHSNKSLTHNGGGDSQSLAGLVKYALQQYNGDPDKVFIVGGSSGAMEANVLAATYPDVFKGAASYSGVPAGCWSGSPMSTPLSSDLSCPLGNKASRFTPQQWADLAHSLYPTWTGAYPKMLIVHGTADTAVTINNLKAQLDQWSMVKGLTFSKNVTNDPIANWKRIVYGDGTQLVGFEVANGPHIPPFQGDATLTFFGLMGNPPVGTTSPPATPTVPPVTPTVPPVTPTPPPAGTVPKYGQCGGEGYSGPTMCIAPYTCTPANQYYSQCL